MGLPCRESGRTRNLLGLAMLLMWGCAVGAEGEVLEGDSDGAEVDADGENEETLDSDTPDVDASGVGASDTGASSTFDATAQEPAKDAGRPASEAGSDGSTSSAPEAGSDGATQDAGRSDAGRSDAATDAGRDSGGAAGGGGTPGGGTNTCRASECKNECWIGAPLQCCKDNGTCGCSWAPSSYCM